MIDLEKIAVSEIISPQYAVTSQYLESIILIKDGDKFKVERIQNNDTCFYVYFPIKGERFFFGIKIDKETLSVCGSFIESGNNCYLTATSSNLTLDDLAKYTSLKHTSGWSIGDIRRNGSIYDFSRISFEPLKTECYSTEDAICSLLDHLESDKKGIVLLSKNSNACIEIEKHQYVSGNSGLFLSRDTLFRIIELNLSIDIDSYIVGDPIKS
jgi:hypothetical protein